MFTRTAKPLASRMPLTAAPPARGSVPRAAPVRTSPAGLEAEADAMASRIVDPAPTMRRSAGAESRPPAEGPAMALAARSRGEPLDGATRAVVEPVVGADLGGVRVHADHAAAAAAEAMQASAFTIGRDVYFGARRHDMHGSEGRRLLAHELSHVVQQGGGSPDQGLSAAGVGVQREPAPAAPAHKDQKDGPKIAQTFVLPPELLAPLRLQPPSLLAPKPQPSLMGGRTLSLTPPSGGGGSDDLSLARIQQGGLLKSLAPSALPKLAPSLPPAGPLAPTATPSLALAPQAGASAPTTTPTAPEAITLKDFGPVSVGVRFGIPDHAKDTKPGDPLTAMQESLRMAEIINYHVNGVTPSFASLDVGKLIGVTFSIFATHIDSELARKLASKVSAKPSTGPKVTFDATVIFQTSPAVSGGGGLVTTVTF